MTKRDQLTRDRLARHDKRMKELMDGGMEKDAASKQAFDEITGKAQPLPRPEPSPEQKRALAIETAESIVEWNEKRVRESLDEVARWMESKLADVRRDIARIDDANYPCTLLDATISVNHELAWFMANCETVLGTATKFSAEHAVAKAQLAVMKGDLK